MSEDMSSLLLEAKSEAEEGRHLHSNLCPFMNISCCLFKENKT